MSYCIDREIKYSAINRMIMDENKVLIGILMIVAVSVASYFVISSGSSGAAVSNTPYLTCCCDIIPQEKAPTALVRSQIQTFENNCQAACSYNYKGALVLAEIGRC